MLVLLSPAKTLDFSPSERDLPATKPALHSRATTLAKRAKELSIDELGELMEISKQLSETAHGYFQNWKQKWDAKGSKQAILAFQGDVYQGLQAATLSKAQLERAQKQLRILSGLYGVLRPLDRIQPYRLEMGRPLKTSAGKSLYDYWNGDVTAELNCDLPASTGKSQPPVVVNLASNEYFKVVQAKQLEAQLVTPVFKDKKPGKDQKLRVVSFYAKRARGLMARYIIEAKVESPEGLQDFAAEGYRYHKSLSTDAKPMFTRTSPTS